MPPFSHRSGVASRDIVPDEFVETMDARSSDDIDTVAEALRVAERQPSSTPTADRRRCPDCLSVKVAPRPDTGVSACGECGATFGAALPSLADARRRADHALDDDDAVCPACGSSDRYPVPETVADIDAKYVCLSCGERHDEPDTDTDTETMTDETETRFRWIDDEQLHDDTDRGLTPVLRGVADRDLIEIVVRVREPWTADATPSYRDLAEIVPYSRTWVGDRVREWRDGEHRELVPGPWPTVDAGATARTAATDGGAKTGE